MATNFKPAVEVDLGANPGRVKFNTVEQARNWIQVEQDAWGDELVPSSELRPLTTIINRTLQKQRAQISAVQNAVNHASAESSDGAPDDFVSALQAYRDGEVLHSDSIVGRKTLELISSSEKLEEKTTALSFLGVAINHPAKIDDFRQNAHWPADYVAIMSGVAKYHDFVTGGDADIISRFDEYAKKNLGEWERQLALHQNEHFDAVEVIRDKEEKITEEHTRQQTEFHELKSGYETGFSEFEEFYKEGLRAKAPVKYWESKATKHSTIGGLLFTVFIVGCVVAAIYGFNLGSEFSDAIRETSSGASTQTPQSAATPTIATPESGEAVSLMQLAFSKFLVLLVPGFFAVWVLRILLKVALSNMAIADDARHRVTMVETFLSLMEHTDKLDESDRILMLQALFRPIPGSNDEDSGPPNWFDVMMTQVKKT